jgi:hypothetical protein
MRMDLVKLKALSNDQLIHNFERAIVLNTKNDANGQSPFDVNQLREELRSRMKPKE